LTKLFSKTAHQNIDEVAMSIQAGMQICGETTLLFIAVGLRPVCARHFFAGAREWHAACGATGLPREFDMGYRYAFSAGDVRQGNEPMTSRSARGAAAPGTNPGNLHVCLHSPAALADAADHGRRRRAGIRAV
jgi:hypothetical protein